MKRQHLKQLGYGFSALVLGTLAVNFFPVTNVYAEPVDPVNPPVVIAEPSLEVTTPTSANITYTIGDDPLVFEGTFEGEDLIITVDDVAIDGSDIEIGDGEFSAEIEFEETGVYAVKIMALSGDEVAAQNFTVTVEDTSGAVIPIVPTNETYDRIEKAININESFVVETPTDAQVYVYYVNADDDAEYDGMADVIPATNEQIVVEKTSGSEYTITPLQAGRYIIYSRGFVMVDGRLTLKETDVFLTAIAAMTEAATTITDIASDYADAETEYFRAYEEFANIYYDPDATEEEKAAAEAAFDQRVDAIDYESMELREVNAFGDDSMAIWEAAESGKEITTKVSVKSVAEVDVDENVKDALLDKLDITYAGNVKYYDVEVVVYADGEEIGTLKELTNEETVVISGFDGPAAGFKRVFQVVRYHTYVDGWDDDGNPIEKVEVTVIDDVEFDEATGSIAFASDRFSMYLVSYKDVFAPSVNTGVFTGEGGSASSSAALSVVAVVAAIALAGAVKIAKARK